MLLSTLTDFCRFGTESIQRRLRGHQYPTDCTNVKFAFAHYGKHGIGSMLHSAAEYIGTAYNLKRIYIWYQPIDVSVWMNEGSFCKKMNTTTFACFLEELTNCTIPSLEELKKAPTWNNKFDNSQDS